MTEARRFCENCGTEIGPTANFCPNCGARQGQQVSSPTPPTGPSASPQRQEGHTLRNIVIIVILVIVLIAMIRGCGDSSSTTNKEAAARTFTSADYAELATDPRSFRGASVDVSGRIFRNPEVKGSETSFQMFADPENSEWNTIVHAEGAPSDLANGDTVRVKGTVKGAREGENAFGGTVKAVEVDANSVDIEKSKSKAGL